MNTIVLDIEKITLAMANNCIDVTELLDKSGIKYGTYRNIVKGNPVRPSTAGKIAKALNVDVQKIILINS